MKVKLKLPLRQATGYYCVEADGLSTILPLNAVLRPGNRGTKKLVNQYGDKLLCVRYRYDEAAKKRYKTVELIVDEINWSPKTTPVNNTFLFIDWNEKELQEIAKSNGGTWSHTRKLWKLNYETILKLGLEARIRNE